MARKSKKGKQRRMSSTITTYDIFNSSVNNTINENQEKFIDTIFNILKEICTEEEIEYTETFIFSKAEHREEGFKAGSYLFDPNGVNEYRKISIEATLSKSMKLLTLQHEVGHHFAIKDMSSRSEKLANLIGYNVVMDILESQCPSLVKDYQKWYNEWYELILKENE